MGDFLKNKIVVPRKRHRCAWCSEWCEVGQQAWYRAYVFDREFQSDYIHPECYQAMLDSDFGFDDGFEFGEQQRGKTYEESHA